MGKTCAILITHGQQRSEVYSYPWAACQVLLENLAEKHGAGSKKKGSQRDRAVGPGLEVTPMDNEAYLRHMGVADPKKVLIQ